MVVHYCHQRFENLAKGRYLSQHPILTEIRESEITVSSTVDKALSLLAHFTQKQPQLGLSELSRKAGIDKATAHRMLAVMCRHGLLEQDSVSRLYRLGAGTLRLSRIREASLPTAAIIDDVLQRLAKASGETAHVSMIAGDCLATVGVAEGSGPLHVTLDAGERLPFHATASGIACLAYMPESTGKRFLQRKLDAYTDKTETTAAVLAKLINHAQVHGVAHVDQGYEADVYGLAAPIFGSDGLPIGAVAIASSAYKMTRERKVLFGRLVRDAAIELTRKRGAEPPENYVASKRKAAA